jgi:hypothetical protein
MAERYWHELCFTGSEDSTPLIEAAEAAGFNFEFGGSGPDRSFVGTAVLLDRAEERVKQLEAELAETRSS